MANSIAVLLIIGSAAVGPIEAQTTGRDIYVGGAPPDVVARRPNDYKLGRPACLHAGESIGTGKFDEGPCHPESLPELCERAMREIGIDTKMQSGFVSYGWREQNGKFLYAFGAWSPSKSSGDDWPVRCIPVPEGYRR